MITGCGINHTDFVNTTNGTWKVYFSRDYILVYTLTSIEGDIELLNEEHHVSFPASFSSGLSLNNCLVV